jgi:nicotinate-nucleotide adenylyltransferase
MRIGVFGGTFDPVHLGHLIIAEQAREQAQLDEVLFVPAAQPPHKIDEAITPFERRVEMLALAIAGHPSFRIDTLERDRPGPSYTADTLAELHARQPDDTLALLVGSDVLPDFAKWRDPGRILELAELIVAERRGSAVWSAERLRQELALPVESPLRLRLIDVPLTVLASTDVRERVRTGRSVRYLVPRAVEEYIRGRGLYRV